MADSALQQQLGGDGGFGAEGTYSYYALSKVGAPAGDRGFGVERARDDLAVELAVDALMVKYGRYGVGAIDITLVEELPADVATLDAQYRRLSFLEKYKYLCRLHDNIKGQILPGFWDHAFNLGFTDE